MKAPYSHPAATYGVLNLPPGMASVSVFTQNILTVCLLVVMDTFVGRCNLARRSPSYLPLSMTFLPRGLISSQVEHSDRLEVPYHYPEAPIDPVTKKKGRKPTGLDANHNTFLLVDDGRVGVFGGEIEFRAKVEKEISKQTPIVTIVIQGGIGTIE